MSHNVNAADEVIEDFKKQFAEFKIEHIDLINALIEKRNSAGKVDPLSDMFWDAVDELKSQLGTKAANGCSDNEEKQEMAINSVENWVSKNYPEQLPLILWIKGAESGAKVVRDELEACKTNKSLRSIKM